MELYFNIALIAVICVCIIDISGLIDELESMLSKWLGKKCRVPKPFSCSLCSTFWLSLIYLIYTNNLNLLNIAVTLLIAISTDIIGSVIYLIKNLLSFVITKLNNLIY